MVQPQFLTQGLVMFDIEWVVIAHNDQLLQQLQLGPHIVRLLCFAKFSVEFLNAQLWILRCGRRCDRRCCRRRCNRRCGG